MKKHFTSLYFICLSCIALAQDFAVPTPLPNHKRVGCICNDGSRSQATGRGACSNKGGVRYWLYADVSIYTQYSQNLPAIPSNKLIPLTPEQVRNFLKVIERLPAIPDPKPEERQNKSEPNNSDRDKTEERPSDYDEDAPPRKRIVKSTENDCPCEGERRSWQVMDFLLPFVLVLCIILLFVIIFYVIKKIIQ